MSILSPLLAKEFSQIARARRFFAPRCVLLAILLIVTWFCTGSPEDRVGMLLFIYVAEALLLAAVIISPLAMAGVIAGERDNQTLELLMLTKMSRNRIVLEKGLSRILYLANTTALALPFLIGAGLYGGVGIKQVITATGFIAGAIAICCSISLFMSAVRPNARTALASSYFYIFILLLVSFFTCGLLCAIKQISLAAVINPFFSIAASFSDEFRLEYKLLEYAWLPFLLVSLLISLGAYLFVLRKVGQFATPQAPPNSIRTPIRLKATRLAPVDSLFRPHQVVQDFLVVIKRHSAVTVVVMVAVLSTIALSTPRTLIAPPFYMLLALVTLAVATIMTFLRGAAAFAQERETGRLELILSTPLHGREILRCAYLSQLNLLCLFWAAPILLVIIAKVLPCNHAWGSVPAPMPTFVIAIVHLHGLLLVGMLISLYSESLMQAANRTAVFVALFVSLPLLPYFFLRHSGTVSISPIGLFWPQASKLVNLLASLVAQGWVATYLWIRVEKVLREN